ncbi:MAG: UDP-N-acetylmuramoyl-L-alanyl-D-glutamate--2,6-diaminopimelate ligase, partial [Chloroflexi bacterium]
MSNLRELIHHISGIRGIWTEPAGPVGVTQVTADSRAVTPGSLFVAVKGGTADGHRYLADAF